MGWDTQGLCVVLRCLVLRSLGASCSCRVSSMGHTGFNREGYYKYEKQLILYQDMGTLPVLRH